MMAGAETPPRDAEAVTWEKIAFGNARNLVKSSVNAEAPATTCATTAHAVATSLRVDLGIVV
jgi:hypothetical protein